MPGPLSPAVLYAADIAYHERTLGLRGSPIRVAWLPRPHRDRRNGRCITLFTRTEPIRPAAWVILLNARYSPRDNRQSLAHEYRHVWQIVSGLASVQIVDGAMVEYWAGAVVDTTRTDYVNLPWEIDAVRYAAPFGP